MNCVKYILFVIGVLAFMSCNQDEVTEINRSEISFSVRTQGVSRGSVVTTDGINSSGEQFRVWAYHRTSASASQQLYINDLLTYNGTEWRLTENRYWPQGGFMDFYCVYPVTSLNEINNVGGVLGNGNGVFDYTVSTDLSKQDDLLYATAIDEQRAKLFAVEPVKLNFRHALSQVVFSLALDANFWVKVKEISVCNIKNEGTFEMPLITSSELNSEKADSWGEWTLADGLENYSVSGNVELIKGFSNADDKVETVFSDTDNNPLLLLPQLGEKAVKNGSEWTGVYFKLLCRIDTYAADGFTPVQLFPEDNISSDAYGEVVVPLDIDWKQGKKYKYTFRFKESMFDTIKFSVTVDEYQTEEL